MNAPLRLVATLALSSLALACSSSAAVAPAPTSPTTPTVSSASPVAPPGADATDEGPVCDVVCQGAKVTNLSSAGATVGDAESHTLEETENANQVLDAMHTDLLACYRARVRVMPRSQGTLVLDILIGPDGKVRKIETSGGESLGTAKDCIVRRVQAGEFAPPHGGGTLKIQAPFTFKVQGDEST